MIGVVDNEVAIVKQIRDGVSLSAAEGTARMRFFPSRGGDVSFERLLAERVPAAAIVAFAAAKKAVKWGLSVLPAAPTAVEYTGVIDFAQERSIYNCGTFWKLFAPGRDYVGKPGAWEADEHDGITCYEPFWLLELLNATVTAADDGTELIRREKCRHYRGTANFGLTSARSKRTLAIPLGLDDLNLEALEIEVWLDTAGRIRRAAFNRSGTLTLLDLYDFGQPDAIDLPNASELLPDEE
jgi:hypothetical protein